MAIGAAGAVIVAGAELIKLVNNLQQASIEAAKLAKMSDDDINANFQKKLAEYNSLPLPGEIKPPLGG